jgi:hypothetical protein
MVGYSGTPLAKKLGFKSGTRVSLARLPEEVGAELQDALSECLREGQKAFDLVLLFVKTSAELQEQFPRFAAKLDSSGGLWVAWPKKTSGVRTDLDENRVRAIGLQNGLVDIKVCAISEIWSGLKFVIRVKDRLQRGRGNKP